MTGRSPLAPRDISRLIAFVRARLDEDEAAAMAASDGPWTAWRGRPGLGLRQLEHAVTLPGQAAGSLAPIATASWLDAEHIARHDPARVLREVAAARGILAEYERRAGGGGYGYQAGLGFVIEQMARAWSDHPGYEAAAR